MQSEPTKDMSYIHSFLKVWNIHKRQIISHCRYFQICNDKYKLKIAY